MEVTVNDPIRVVLSSLGDNLDAFENPNVVRMIVHNATQRLARLEAVLAEARKLHESSVELEEAIRACDVAKEQASE
jgi:hypothetical protein